jgi:hypothetical protein
MPTYGALAKVHLKLSANASSVHSNLGNGTLSLLPFTVSVAVYNALSNIPFVATANPGPTAIIPVVATAVQISNLRQLHDEALTARFCGASIAPPKSTQTATSYQCN